jgi:signal transduction histidine kinase
VIEGQLLELDATARLREVALERRFDPLPPCRFDRFQVERALYNLVHNALAETAAGGTVTVSIRAVEEPRFADGRGVEIVVRDTGSGMSAEILAGILRGEPKSTKPGGTGLGTRIVYNAVAAHHGVFAGESVEGLGTTFRMRLPLIGD